MTLDAIFMQSVSLLFSAFLNLPSARTSMTSGAHCDHTNVNCRLPRLRNYIKGLTASASPNETLQSLMRRWIEAVIWVSVQNQGKFTPPLHCSSERAAAGRGQASMHDFAFGFRRASWVGWHGRQVRRCSQWADDTLQVDIGILGRALGFTVRSNATPHLTRSTSILALLPMFLTSVTCCRFS